jgi:hypothetical protein
MPKKNYLRLLFLILAVSVSMILISNARTKASGRSAESADADKCPHSGIQTEFVIWKSLSGNLAGDKDNP